MLNLMTPRLDSENIDFDQLASPSATPRSESNKFQSSFPAKLYLLLESASEDIVSWLEDGKSFRVYDMERFVTSILPQYFKVSKFESFQRQLNLYGFKRIQGDRGTVAYFNANFERGNFSNLNLVRRVPTMRNKNKIPGKDESKNDNGDLAPTSEYTNSDRYISNDFAYDELACNEGLFLLPRPLIFPESQDSSMISGLAKRSLSQDYYDDDLYNVMDRFEPLSADPDAHALHEFECNSHLYEEFIRSSSKPSPSLMKGVSLPHSLMSSDPSLHNQSGEKSFKTLFQQDFHPDPSSAWVNALNSSPPALSVSWAAATPTTQPLQSHPARPQKKRSKSSSSLSTPLPPPLPPLPPVGRIRSASDLPSPFSPDLALSSDAFGSFFSPFVHDQSLTSPSNFLANTGNSASGSIFGDLPSSVSVMAPCADQPSYPLNNTFPVTSRTPDVGASARGRTSIGVSRGVSLSRVVDDMREQVLNLVENKDLGSGLSPDTTVSSSVSNGSTSDDDLIGIKRESPSGHHQVSRDIAMASSSSPLIGGGRANISISHRGSVVDNTLLTTNASVAAAGGAVAAAQERIEVYVDLDELSKYGELYVMSPAGNPILVRSTTRPVSEVTFHKAIEGGAQSMSTLSRAVMAPTEKTTPAQGGRANNKFNKGKTTVPKLPLKTIDTSQSSLGGLQKKQSYLTPSSYHVSGMNASGNMVDDHPVCFGFDEYMSYVRQCDLNNAEDSRDEPPMVDEGDDLDDDDDDDEDDRDSSRSSGSDGTGVSSLSEGCGRKVLEPVRAPHEEDDATDEEDKHLLDCLLE